MNKYSLFTWNKIIPINKAIILKVFQMFQMIAIVAYVKNNQVIK